jgi:hypothetical protein
MTADPGHRVIAFSPTTGVSHPMSAKISGMTISGGSATGAGGQGINGAGVESDASALELDGVTVTGNTAKYCAGICENVYGSLTLDGSTVSGNTSTGTGAAGGIFSYATTINDSTIANNSGAFGAGIDIYGAATITGSTIAGNTSSRAAAGQIEEDATAAAVTLRDSIVSGAGINPDLSLLNGSTSAASFSLIRNPAPVPTGGTVTTDGTDLSGKDPQLNA